MDKLQIKEDILGIIPIIINQTGISRIKFNYWNSYKN